MIITTTFAHSVAFEYLPIPKYQTFELIPTLSDGLTNGKLERPGLSSNCPFQSNITSGASQFATVKGILTSPK